MEFLHEVWNFFLNLLRDTGGTLDMLVTEYGLWVYAILFLIIFCETGLVVTPFLPGDSLLFLAGAIAVPCRYTDCSSCYRRCSKLFDRPSLWRKALQQSQVEDIQARIS